jgi:Mg-chelatase subunit ChlD
MAFSNAMLGGNKASGLPQGLTYTENGALSHSTSGDARLDYFSKILRDSSEDQIKQSLLKAWKESPLDTMRLIAQKRDCRGGSGEKKVFYTSMRWLVSEYPDAGEMFMSLVPEYGTWKDGFFCFCETPMESKWLAFVADQLTKDLEVITKSTEDDTEIVVVSANAEEISTKPEKKSKSVSLSAKWVPSEHSAIDKKYKGVYDRLAIALGQKADNTGRRVLRTQYLAPLRSYINVVESLMCGKRWNEIVYDQVPSVAMNRLRKAFTKNDPNRFKQFLADVSSGKKTIKAGQLFPHDLVKHYVTNHGQLDDVVEAQWKALVEKTREGGQLEKTIVLSDVSGSMTSNNSLPLQVSIALGLMISTLTKGAFKGNVITFETTPRFHAIDTTATLQQQVKQLAGAPWAGSTNLVAVFDLILQRAQQYKLKQDEMPEKLVIISDMQFSSADSGNLFSNFEVMKAKYRKAGYDMPAVIFWNVAGRTEDFPVTKSEFKTAMLSGFSPSLLKYVAGFEITSPYDMMRNVLDSERYEQVNVPSKYMSASSQ